MKPHDVLDSLRRCAGRWHALPSELAARTAAVAQLLHDGWPNAALHVCSLSDDGRTEMVALDAGAQPDTDWQTRLHESRDWRTLSVDPRQRFVVRPLSGEPTGQLALLLKPTDNKEVEALAELYLDSVAVELERQALCRQHRAEIVRLDQQAAVGEMAGPLAHEFTNFLNVLLLQVSVMEYLLPEGERTDLVEIRRQGALAANVVERFHRHRLGQGTSPVRVELDRLLKDAVEELAGDSDSRGVTLAAQYGGGTVTGYPADLRRLLRFLVSNAIRLAEATGKEVALASSAADAHLSIQTSGPVMTSEDVFRLFDVTRADSVVDTFEMSACRSMARRANIVLKSGPREQGGVRIDLAFNGE